MGDRPRRTFKQLMGSALMAGLAVIVAIIGIAMFLVKVGVDLAFLGSIWSFITGDWKVGLTLLAVAVGVSIFVLG